MVSEDERLVVAAIGVLGNDQIPEEVTGSFIVNAGVITSNRGVSASLEADGVGSTTLEVSMTHC